MRACEACDFSGFMGGGLLLLRCALSLAILRQQLKLDTPVFSPTRSCFVVRDWFDCSEPDCLNAVVPNPFVYEIPLHLVGSLSRDGEIGASIAHAVVCPMTNIRIDGYLFKMTTAASNVVRDARQCEHCLI